MESDDARLVDCSWIVEGSMGAGRVLLRQAERGRRTSKIHEIKTNNLAGADLGRCTPVNRPTGLKMYECLQARVYLVWGCFWMSFQDVYWLHGMIFSFYNYWGVHTHRNDGVALFRKEIFFSCFEGINALVSMKQYTTIAD